MDAAQWLTYEAAAATGHPVGFVFTEADPYFFLDIDACLADGQWKPYATELVARFPGAYVEASVSGDGLHVVGSYSGPRPVHGTRNWDLHLELYTAGRFMALGTGAIGDADTDCTLALHGLAAEHFPPRTTVTAGDWTTVAREDWTGTDDDDELVRKARASSGTAATFGGTASFEALWTADEAVLSVMFDDPQRAFDRSRTDASLARHLAFWTGNNCERIVRLMWKSALAREKWNREAWLQQTVLMAVASTAKVYDYQRPVAPEGTRPGYQFQTIPDQVELFKGCIYVASRNRVMLADGRLLTRDNFNAMMPSSEFARDASTSPKTTRKPWEAFTESQGFDPLCADDACFEPQLDCDAPIRFGNRTYANTYRPIETPRKAGDPARFVEHVHRLLPHAGDQAIILAYLAAVVQHKGVKFQWCPLLQGVEGNGKTLLTRVLREAIGADHFHSPQAHDLSNKFNAWILGKILIGIEDIYVPNERREVIEVLKPLITNGDAIGVQGKGLDQVTARSCANFIINSNHRDAIQKTRNDRRFAVFFTAQQEREDLERDGMTPDYFRSLYDWLRTDGYAIVHEHLATYAIPDELNPAHQGPAPNTSTTNEAVEAGQGPIEQYITDAITEERAGFCEPWVSRTALTKNLRHDHYRVGPARLVAILRELGYVRHPGLPDGRTNGRVAPFNTRTELWVLKTHLAAQLAHPPTITRAYEVAQTKATQVFDDNTSLQK